MDEEQGLASPIAGGLRGIRRSVSSSIFTGRAVPPQAQGDTISQNLISKNSLTFRKCFRSTFRNNSTSLKY